MQKSDKISLGMTKLIRSLGFKITLSKRNKTCTNAKGGGKVGLYNSLYISGEGLDEIPTLLSRKKAKSATKGIDFLITQISIKKIGEGECINFTLDNTSGDFLLDDLTVVYS